MKKSNFIRVKEDFICENCGHAVKGNGYTNHCPDCLFSKHVDKFTPGDREAECKGLMEPIDYFSRNGETYIVHKCIACGKIINNKMSSEDSIDSLLRIKN